MTTRGKQADDAARAIATQCLGYRTRRVTRAVTRIYDTALRPLGIRITQLTILVAITRRHGPRAADLVEALDIEQSTLSRNLGVLRRKGLVRTKPGEDGRSETLELTAKGRALLAEARPHWEKAQREATELLGKPVAGSIQTFVDRHEQLT